MYTEWVETSSGGSFDTVFTALSSLENLKLLDLRKMIPLSGDFWGSLVGLQSLECLKVEILSADIGAGGAMSKISELFFQMYKLCRFSTLASLNKSTMLVTGVQSPEATCKAILRLLPGDDCFC